MKAIGTNLVPGKQLCPTCVLELDNGYKQSESIAEASCSSDDHDDAFINDTAEIWLDKSRENLNSTLIEMELSPFKVH